MDLTDWHRVALASLSACRLGQQAAPALVCRVCVRLWSLALCPSRTSAIAWGCISLMRVKAECAAAILTIPQHCNSLRVHQLFG